MKILKMFMVPRNKILFKSIRITVLDPEKKVFQIQYSEYYPSFEEEHIVVA